ncbi:MAG: hypothetical protein JWQ04_3610 [Pedosphaera sp.]|nr:hypothetical protein [Pedosphaera sp.]
MAGFRPRGSRVGSAGRPATRPPLARPSTLNHFGAEFPAKSALIPPSTLNHLVQPAPFRQLELGAWLFSGAWSLDAWSFSNGAEFLTKSDQICAPLLFPARPQPGPARPASAQNQPKQPGTTRLNSHKNNNHFLSGQKRQPMKNIVFIHHRSILGIANGKNVC